MKNTSEMYAESSFCSQYIGNREEEIEKSNENAIVNDCTTIRC